MREDDELPLCRPSALLPLPLPPLPLPPLPLPPSAADEPDVRQEAAAAVVALELLAERGRPPSLEVEERRSLLEASSAPGVLTGGGRPLPFADDAVGSTADASLAGAFPFAFEPTPFASCFAGCFEAAGGCAEIRVLTSCGCG